MKRPLVRESAGGPLPTESFLLAKLLLLGTLIGAGLSYAARARTPEAPMSRLQQAEALLFAERCRRASRERRDVPRVPPPSAMFPADLPVPGACRPQGRDGQEPSSRERPFGTLCPTALATINTQRNRSE